jgi:hypothetical protein
MGRPTPRAPSSSCVPRPLKQKDPNSLACTRPCYVPLGRGRPAIVLTRLRRGDPREIDRGCKQRSAWSTASLKSHMLLDAHQSSACLLLKGRCGARTEGSSSPGPARRRPTSIAQSTPLMAAPLSGAVRRPGGESTWACSTWRQPSSSSTWSPVPLPQQLPQGPLLCGLPVCPNPYRFPPKR